MGHIYTLDFALVPNRLQRLLVDNFVRISRLSSHRSSIACFVYRPVLSAFLLPFGAPLPGAPPCMRQRRFPATAGERHDFPLRVFAPHRALDSMGAVLHLCLRFMVLCAVA